MKWEYILEIPFISKSLYYFKNNSKYNFKGKTYFLLNIEGKVLRDFMIIDGDFNYRPNDNKMMFGGKNGNGTDFWKQKGLDRLEIFEKSINNYDIKKGNDELREKINYYSISKCSTSLSTESMITGSNSSGADLRIKSTPIVCSNDDLYGLRYINPLKNLREKKNNKNSVKKYLITKKILEKSIKISLSDYFKMFPNNIKDFIKYNTDFSEMISKNSSLKISYINDMKIKHLDDDRKYISKSIELSIKRYVENKASVKNTINRLRSIQRSLLLIEHKKLGGEIILGINEKDANLDAAHLYQVRDIKKNNDKFHMIADVNNGILLPKNIHWKFDRDEDVYIDENFSIVDKEKDIILKINEKYINDERKRYLSLRNNIKLRKEKKWKNQQHK